MSNKNSSNLHDALFPPLDEEDDCSNEQHMFSLLHSIQSGDRSPEAAVTAAVLIQKEIDRWKHAIQELECRCVDQETPPEDDTMPGDGGSRVEDTSSTAAAHEVVHVQVIEDDEESEDVTGGEPS